MSTESTRYLWTISSRQPTWIASRHWNLRSKNCSAVGKSSSIQQAFKVNEFHRASKVLSLDTSKQHHKVISRRRRRQIDRWCCFSFPNRARSAGPRFGFSQVLQCPLCSIFVLQKEYRLCRKALQRRCFCLPFILPANWGLP